MTTLEDLKRASWLNEKDWLGYTRRQNIIGHLAVSAIAIAAGALIYGAGCLA